MNIMTKLEERTMPSMEKMKKLRAPKYLENPLSFLMYTREKT